MNTIQNKKCTKCKIEKKISKEFFYTDKRTLDGFCSECKTCAAAKGAIYRKNNSAIISQKEKLRKHLPGRHFSKAKREAKKRGMIWEITREKFDELLSMPCHYCKDKLDTKQKYTVGCGLDRIDNTIGYLISNVLPCCKICNAIRREILTVNETEILIDKLLEIRNLKDNPV